jgi:hypothetical protein
MAGQGIDRREVLRIMALAAAASKFPGFSRWVFAHDHARAASQQTAPPAEAYPPQFFNPHEYATVERLAELIIPSDGSPGAREAGVAEFIDFMTLSDPKIQFRFRYGLAWLDAHAKRLYGGLFRELTELQQTEIVEHLGYSEKFRPGEQEGRQFFRLMREYTIMGFYTTRIGMEELGCPCLELYSESPECPHVDDREHLKLAEDLK